MSIKNQGEIQKTKSKQELEQADMEYAMKLQKELDDEMNSEINNNERKRSSTCSKIEKMDEEFARKLQDDFDNGGDNEKTISKRLGAVLQSVASA